MGDRVSIQFVQEVKGWNKDDKPHTDKSVVLFHHWGGEWFPKLAKEWIKNHNLLLANDRQNNASCPISRMDVDNLMMQFIRFLANESEFDSSWGVNIAWESFDTHTLPKNKNYFTSSVYLGKDENDGDNSDNGHHEIEVPEAIVHENKKKREAS